MNYKAVICDFDGVLGKTMNINGEARTVIGVMPPRFEWNIADLWLPAALSRSDDPRSPRTFGRGPHERDAGGKSRAHIGDCQQRD